MRAIFEQFFSKQLAGKSSAPKRRRCGVCEVCQLPDCGTCSHCRDMTKFGGSGRSKQACVLRRCPNMAVQTAEEDEVLDLVVEMEGKAGMKKAGKKGSLEKKKKVSMTWKGQGHKEGHKTFYTSALVNHVQVCSHIHNTDVYHDPYTCTNIYHVTM